MGMIQTNVGLRNIGWIKDPYDTRDYLHRPPRALVLPTKVDNSDRLCQVRDQDGEGCCSAMGVGTTVNAWGIKLGFSIGDWLASPRWIYNLARLKEGWLDKDWGAYPRDCYQQLVDNGCLAERWWQWVPTIETDVNPLTYPNANKAIKYQKFSYWRVDNGLDNIRSALSEGNIVSFGGAWFDRWDWNTSGLLQEVSVSGTASYGHVFVFYGYEDNYNNSGKGYLLMQNSFGTGWGNQGRALLPYQAIDVIKQKSGYDAYYMDTIMPTIIRRTITLNMEH